MGSDVLEVTRFMLVRSGFWVWSKVECVNELFNRSRLVDSKHHGSNTCRMVLPLDSDV